MVQKIKKSANPDIKLKKADKSNKKEKSSLIVGDTQDTKTVSKRAYNQTVGTTIGNSDNEAPSKKKTVKKNADSKTSKAQAKTANQKSKPGREVFEMSREEVVNYLKSWKNDRSNWKHNSRKDVWINDHKFSGELVPYVVWPLFVEYFATASTFVKMIIIEDSWRVIRNTINPDLEPERTSYERARELTKHLKSERSYK